jgi:glucose-6-phosphate 1-dehydrogenase
MNMRTVKIIQVSRNEWPTHKHKAAVRKAVKARIKKNNKKGISSWQLLKSKAEYPNY